ncbi:hypothetical protein HPB50_011440 [Hyalomma asiaticum]|uniref:Uncharacterized protein n=1 Tax=Hyalomma asiaticum TaxID=266040 RepID=A0ACB7SMF5_HYAAI|nr:hypothetical protein HPB50_011440 [Hyalomma asiaticum]
MEVLRTLSFRRNTPLRPPRPLPCTIGPPVKPSSPAYPGQSCFCAGRFEKYTAYAAGLGSRMLRARMQRIQHDRCVGATLGAFLWLALLSGTCNGYPGSPSWQVLAPGAAPAEHKMAKAFVVHLPIHTTQLEPVEEQRQPATVSAAPGGPAFNPGGYETHGQNQGSLLKKRLRRLRRRRKYYRMRSSSASVGPDAAVSKRRVRVRKPRPAEQPAAHPPPPPPPPEVKRRPEHDKPAYDIQVDHKLPIILIALDKPLASHAKVQSVSAWKEPVSRPASSKEDRSSGNSKEWRPIIYPKRQRQHSTSAQQRQWSRWNKNLDRRTLWTKEERQSSWKPSAPSSDSPPPAAPAKEQQHNDGGSNEAKLLLLLVHENSPASGDRGKDLGAGSCPAEPERTDSPRLGGQGTSFPKNTRSQRKECRRAGAPPDLSTAGRRRSRGPGRSNLIRSSSSSPLGLVRQCGIRECRTVRPAVRLTTPPRRKGTITTITPPHIDTKHAYVSLRGQRRAKNDHLAVPDSPHVVT